MGTDGFGLNRFTSGNLKVHKACVGLDCSLAYADNEADVERAQKIAIIIGV